MKIQEQAKTKELVIKKMTILDSGELVAICDYDIVDDQDNIIGREGNQFRVVVSDISGGEGIINALTTLIENQVKKDLGIDA